MRYQHGGGVRASAKAAISAALFASAGLALPLSAMAADAQGPLAEPQGTTVDGVTATSAKGAPESPKYTAAALDTPQTITVVPKAVIEAQNLLTLRDILSTVPGITFGAGEGGGGYGDSINLRGYSANSDITTDGVRDSAQYTRSDPFNLEQLEVTNGANGAIAGSGSVGGSINLVSKTPGLRDNTIVSVGGGADSYMRATVDANKTIADGVAVRLNAMVHSNDAPGRDVEKFERYGIAPSIAFGLGTDTRASLALYYQHDDNIPQYGVPFYNGDGVPGIDPSTYLGYANIDEQVSEVLSYTARLDHDVTDNLRLRLLTRYQTVDQRTVVDAPQGAPCLANGMKPAGWSETAKWDANRQLVITSNTSGYTACAVTDPAPGYYRPSGPRGSVRDTQNTTFYSQGDVISEFEFGGMKHSMTFGASLLSETFSLDAGNLFRTPTGATVPLPDMLLTDPDVIYTGAINYVRGSIQDGQRDNQSVYAFDTIEITPRFQINGGVRFDHNKGRNFTTSYVTTPGATFGTSTKGAVATSEDNLFSYRVGAVYKPVANASLYVAYGNTMTPSQSAVNGSCTATGTGANCNVDPEEAENLEIGGKWDVFDSRLSLTGSVFRNERTNYKVPSGDPTIPDQVLEGSSRVDGVALGASGKLTDDWAVFANYTYLKSEVLQSVSDFVAGGGVPGTNNADFIKGDPLTSVPEHAFSVFTTYDLPHRVQIGYGVTYQGEMYLTQHFGIVRPELVAAGGQPGVIAGFAGRSTIPLVKSPDYFVHRLVVTWQATDNAELRLNINNVLDEEYYNRGRNNGWATPGDTRNATLTLNYRF